MKTIAEFIRHLAGIIIYAKIMALLGKDRDVLMRTTT